MSAHQREGAKTQKQTNQRALSLTLRQETTKPPSEIQVGEMERVAHTGPTRLQGDPSCPHGGEEGTSGGATHVRRLKEAFSKGTLMEKWAKRGKEATR